MTAQSHSESASGREIIVERIFDAPRPLVWSCCWTEAERVSEWWGPQGMPTRVEELDLRPGGHWRYVLVAPGGSEFVMEGTFSQIVEPELIVTTAAIDEGEGDGEPSEVVLTYAFDDLGGKTKLTLTIEYETAEDRDRHVEMGVVLGWNSNFDCLDDYLPSVA